jgi:hypothetical protein
MNTTEYTIWITIIWYILINLWSFFLWENFYASYKEIFKNGFILQSSGNYEKSGYLIKQIFIKLNIYLGQETVLGRQWGSRVE